MRVRGSGRINTLVLFFSFDPAKYTSCPRVGFSNLRYGRIALFWSEKSLTIFRSDAPFPRYLFISASQSGALDSDCTEWGGGGTPTFARRSFVDISQTVRGEKEFPQIFLHGIWTIWNFLQEIISSVSGRTFEIPCSSLSDIVNIYSGNTAIRIRSLRLICNIKSDSRQRAISRIRSTSVKCLLDLKDPNDVFFRLIHSSICFAGFSLYAIKLIPPALKGHFFQHLRNDSFVPWNSANHIVPALARTLTRHSGESLNLLYIFEG